jgi:glycosyltransferase involved in cell wall biosynthesis
MANSQSTRIKALFIPSWYPNKDTPFSGIFIRRHAISVSEFCDIGVVYFHFEEKNSKPRIDFWQDGDIFTMQITLGNVNINNYFLKAFSIIVKNNVLFLTLKAFKIFKKEFGAPHIIHSHVILPSGIFSLLINLMTRIPYVITEHSGPFSIHLNTRLKRFLCKIILARSRKIIPVSEFLMNNMYTFFSSSKYEVVPNVVDTKIFFPYEECKKDEQKKKILHVSLLNDKIKNISGIIRAIVQISKTRDDFEFLIVGDGPDRQELERLSRTLDPDEKFIFFLGSKSEMELARIMRESDFFILNSEKETFSIVTAEALSSGIPVISTRCGGPEEYINVSNGIILETQNSLETSIYYMLDNFKKYNSRMLHEEIEKKFAYSVVGKKFFNIYKEVVSTQIV